MENIRKWPKNERGSFPRGGISILHVTAMNKCAKTAYTYPIAFGYKPWYVSFPPRIAWN